jgi:DNA polymerase-3 subunit beta
MSLVATDGHRLALVTAPREAGAKPLAGDGGEVKVILPRKTLLELGRLLADADGDVGFSQGENHLFFDIGGRVLISRMIDGQFPAYERVIPKHNDKRIDFDRERLASAVRRVALLSNERSRAVRFHAEKGRVEVVSSSPEFGEAREEILVDYAAAPVQICFNAQYVLDFLGAVESEGVTLEFKDEMSQALMKPAAAEGYDYTYVIMPMRV